MRKIDNSKLQDLQQPVDEATYLLVLLRDNDVQFKNVLKLLLFMKKIVFANLSDQKIKGDKIARIPADTIQILEDLNHIAYISNELAKALHKFN